jgi:hypothetical protein
MTLNFIWSSHVDYANHGNVGRCIVHCCGIDRLQQLCRVNGSWRISRCGVSLLTSPWLLLYHYFWALCIYMHTGGLAAYLHADRWARAVGQECRVVAVPDSGCAAVTQLDVRLDRFKPCLIYHGCVFLAGFSLIIKTARHRAAGTLAALGPKCNSRFKLLTHLRVRSQYQFVLCNCGRY